MMKIFLTYIIVIILTQQLFSQHAGFPPHDPRSNSTSRNYAKNNLVSAKYDSDKCIAWNKESNHLKAKNWYYRGLIYQKFYENFDSLNESFENKYSRIYNENEFKILFGKLTKDTTLLIAVESYLKCICSDIKNDSLNYEKILNDSIYRKFNIEKFNTFEFTNDRYIDPLKDTLLPQILEFINNGALRKWEKEQIYIEIFTGINENTKGTE